MKLKNLRTLTIAVVFVAGACSDSELPTAVSPRAAISDAVHDDGNAHFFFLPPMVSAPTVAGEFDGNQQPVVEICVWSGSDCGANLALYTMETGPGSETIRVDTTTEKYIVNWHTDAILNNWPIDQDAGQSYRIRVLVGAQVLGYADVQVVENGKELKNVDTGEYIPLLDGRTLPVKFRVEEGFEEQATGDVVSAGYLHSCAVQASGDAYCWGHNYYGQIGDGSITRTWVWGKPNPTLVIGSHQFVSVTAGGYHSCGVDTEGDAYCWGFNGSGQLGDGSGSLYSASPSLVSGSHKFRTLSAGQDHTCGLADDGQGYCWGNNAYGQLGHGTVTNAEAVPLLVGGGHTFVSIDATGSVTCALTPIGDAYCWGYNYQGQVGDGTSAADGPTDFRKPTPALVVGSHVFSSVNAGGYHSCGLTTAGEAYCWGFNRYGQVGDGTYSTSPPYSKPVPTQVTGFLSFEQLSAGNYHSCAIVTGGEAFCWGYNYYGGLGDGTTTMSGYRGKSSPVAVIGGYTFESVSAGGSHTCGVTVGGGAYCWGYNFYGMLGDGTSTLSSSPVFALDLDATAP